MFSQKAGHDTGTACKNPEEKLAGAVTFKKVLSKELDDIAESRRHRHAEGIAVEKGGGEEAAFDSHLIGLALSGGGIRSATFSLGVLQYLASKGFLSHLDYLSTVSGGGYIGAWLLSCIKRMNNGKGLDEVTELLEPNRSSEKEAIAFLRQYSNYLTPRVSLLSADTWLLGTIWFRNTLLNLAVLIACFSSIALIFRLVGRGWCGLLQTPHFGNSLWLREVLPLLLALFPLSIAVAMICRRLWTVSTIALHLESGRTWADGDVDGEGRVKWRIVPLLLVSSLAYSYWLWRDPLLFAHDSLLIGIRGNWTALTFGFIAVQTYCRFPDCYLAKETNKKWLYLWCAIFPFAAGFVTALALRGVALLIDAQSTPQRPWFALTWGPPLVMTAFALGVIVHMGLMGRDLPDAAREWLSRLRALMFITSAAWMAVVGGTIYGPLLIIVLGMHVVTGWSALLAWAGTSIGGLLAGKSARTNGEEGSKPGMGKSSLEVFARIGPYVFLAGFLLLISFGVHSILVHNLPADITAHSQGGTSLINLSIKPGSVTMTGNWSHPEPDTGFTWLRNRYWGHLAGTKLCAASGNPPMWPLSGIFPLLGICLAAGFLLSLRVDINDFSMHHFYKNRLVRCYLGASRCKERKPNPFTGFDDEDDVKLAAFRACPNSKVDRNHYYGPYPIINVALNVSSGGQLQYQERKANSYVFTPYYSGYAADNKNEKMRLRDEVSPPPETPGSYRPTEKCATDGVKLGMAMAISGAAANPNMGYHTSAAVAFLLTVFNVRLGWWLGNPRKDAFDKSSPNCGLLYTFSELFGAANAESKFVNLSDGGHFDNMGLYELVRRRCRYIICCDGEQDVGMKFNGIGNAIRKCRTDFGVEIELPLEHLKRVGGLSRTHCVVGTITYPEQKKAHEEKVQKMKEDSNGRPFVPPSVPVGYLVYLKSSLTGDEPSDVLEYRARQASFPHQSTGDQWFDESQFESYRRLGLHIAETAFSSVETNTLTPAIKREDLFKALYQIWFPPSAAVEKHSAAHADIYAKLMEMVRSDKDLGKLDKELFADRMSTKEWDHKTSHLCNEMIQFIERVFYDLGLEDGASRNHPYIQGWISIFRYWAKRDSFKTAWHATKCSYPDRFRHFYSVVLGGEEPTESSAPDMVKANHASSAK